MFCLAATGVRLGFAIGEAQDARVVERLHEVGISAVASGCEYLASEGEPDSIQVTFVADAQTRTESLTNARLDALYGLNWDTELLDGRHTIPDGSAYACPLAVRWDPAAPHVVAAEHDVLYVAGGPERSNTTLDVAMFGVITLTALGMWTLVSAARGANGRRNGSGRSGDVSIGAATLVTGILAYMTFGSVMELVEDQGPVDAAQVLNARGAPAVARSCRVLVRDGWGEQLVVTFDADGETRTQPLAHAQELRGNGWSDFELSDGLHESPPGSIYPCPLELRYDPQDATQVMAQRDVAYFFELDERRWNVAVLVGWSGGMLAALALWIMWWPAARGPRRNP